MTNEEIATKLTAHEHEIGSLKHRMDDQEEQGKTMQKLAISVEKIAISTEHIMQEQKKQGDRLEKLEMAPAKSWNNAKKTAFTAIISTVAGALAVALIMALAQYI